MKKILLSLLIAPVLLFSQGEIDGFTYIGSFEDSYYYHSNDPAESWFDAYNQSISLGGNLVTFSSLNEHEYVINLISEQHWIGLVNEGYFNSNGNEELINDNIIWVDGTDYDYTNLINTWYLESSIWGNVEYCGQIEYGGGVLPGTINDLYCQTDWQPFILEIDKHTIHENSVGLEEYQIENNKTIYDLQGRILNKIQSKGFYIQGNKKYCVIK